VDVILLEKVRNLGSLGDKVSVKPGYGRNYLIPSGKAVRATKESTANFEARRKDLEQREADMLTAAKVRAGQLGERVILISAKASEEGKLFGSVGTREISLAIKGHGVEVAKSEIRLPNGVLREVGEYEVDLQLHSDVTVTQKVKVIAE